MLFTKCSYVPHIHMSICCVPYVHMYHMFICSYAVYHMSICTTCSYVRMLCTTCSYVHKLCTTCSHVQQRCKDPGGLSARNKCALTNACTPFQDPGGPPTKRTLLPLHFHGPHKSGALVSVCVIVSVCMSVYLCPCARVSCSAVAAVLKKRRASTYNSP